MRLRAAAGLGLAGALVLAACSSEPGQGEDGSEQSDTASAGEEAAGAETRTPDAPTTVLPGPSAAELAAATSELLYDTAPVVVVSAPDPESVERAAGLAVEFGAPLLLAPGSPGSSTPSPTPPMTPPITPPTDPPRVDPKTPPPPPAETSANAEPTAASPPPADDPAFAATSAELQRLAPSTIVAVGPQAAEFASAAYAEADVVNGEGATSPEDLELPAVADTSPVESVAILATADPASAAARATAEAAGAAVVELAVPDPRADGAAVRILADNPPEHVVALGDVFGTPDQLSYRVGVAMSGVELPGGGQVLYPYHRHVALYGNPTTAGLGSLGEQGVEESVTRVTELAAEYQAFTSETVVPTFEIIASVASSVPSSGGDYSTEMTPDEIRPYVDAAAAAGIYVVLDLQPGRADFLTQAKLFEEFLLQPHVGLALDPEWRLEPHQVHLEQVGSVTAAEVNSVIAWLADLTRQNNLPQKIVVLHQFRTDMITDRTQVDTSRDELAVLIHVDGFGPPGSKLATWNAIRSDPPPNVWWGWKNFLDEDSPTFTPQQTMEIEPVPFFVSYQ